MYLTTKGTSHKDLKQDIYIPREVGLHIGTSNINFKKEKGQAELQAALLDC